MKKIAIYGKGGIGKSTTTSNLSAAMADMGLKVMQVGCDPKSDSTKTLLRGKGIPTVLDQIRSKKGEVAVEDIAFVGYGGVVCVEAGGPPPGIGCAGRGIITAFKKLEELNTFQRFKPDIVFYDVLGDVVCGGFAMPIREGYADNVFIVTSGEMMSMYAATNIIRAIESFGERRYAAFSGLIHNSKDIEGEEGCVRKLADETGATVIKKIPRDAAVQRAEEMGMTVVEAFPESAMAREYNELAARILEVI
ncbi:MAG: AAA family ATPase [Synergistaceae bacterium]|nr:AAA family ATPase [Synergistaceae bacterium]